MSIPGHQVRRPDVTLPHHGTDIKPDTLPAIGKGYIEGPTTTIEAHSLVTSDGEEKELREKIIMLCADEKQKRKALKGKTSEVSPLRSKLKAAQAALAMNLSKMKELLAGTGRDGQWQPFLKQNGLSRTTADRLVKKHRATQSQIEKGSQVETKELTESEIQAIAKSVMYKCRRLTAKHLADMFIVKLEALLHAQTVEHAASLSTSPPAPSAPLLTVWEENEL